MISDEEAFKQVLYWLQDERRYTLNKFGSEADRTHVEDFNLWGVDREGHWDLQLNTYLYRAKVLGLGNPAGRQELAKFVSTAAGMLSATIQVYGDLPGAGVPSGEIV